MNDTHVGGIFRAVRIRLRLPQEEVAKRAGVSQSTVSRIERGLFAPLPLEKIRAVATVLEIRLEIGATWRGGSLERVMSARHSALHEGLSERLAAAGGWDTAAEVSFSIWGERGVIDRLAYHADRQMLGVFEIKADLSDPAGLIAQVDRYRRLAPEIVRERGWAPTSVSCWAVVADTDTNRRLLAAHASLLRGAFPADGRTFRIWLRDPRDRLDGLTFLAYPHARTGTESLTAIKRVRRPRAA